jgi:low affinity Fe/Cu permease
MADPDAAHDQRLPPRPERKKPTPVAHAGGAAFGEAMARIAGWSSRAAGSSTAFILATLTIAAWLVSGPLFHYSDTWQLVINTSTTIVTFLMVFLIQRSQNKESSAIQLKLNELIAAVQGASNHLISVEDRSEEEIGTLREHYAQLVDLMREDVDITRAHSVEEAVLRHQRKLGGDQPAA